MKMSHALSALVLTAGLACPLAAQAQTTLYLTRTETLGSLNQNRFALTDTVAQIRTKASFYIGSNASSIAFDGRNLYVGGWSVNNPPFLLDVNDNPLPDSQLAGSNMVPSANLSVTQSDANLTDVYDQTAAIVKIILNDDLSRSFLPVPTSRTPNMGANRGVIGLDLAQDAPLPAPSKYGLLATYWYGNLGLPGALTRFDTRTQTPAFAAQTPGTGALLSQGGAAFDFGPGGTGIDFLNASGVIGTDGVMDGGVAAFGIPGRGFLYGTRPDTLFVPVIPATSPPAQTVYGPTSGANTAAALFGAAIINGGGSTTNWRNFEIDPRTGDIALRNNNSLILMQRTGVGSVTQSAIITPPGGVVTSVAGMNAAIMTGFPVNDGGASPNWVIWNDHPSTSSGQPFLNATKITSFDRSSSANRPYVLNANAAVPVTDVAFRKFDPANGNPALTFGSGGDIPDGNGFYDYSWHAQSNQLAILDFANRQVYIFTPKCNLADLAGSGATYSNGSVDVAPDGQLTIEDFVVFLNAFSDSANCDDPNRVPCNPADLTSSLGGTAITDLANPDGALSIEDFIAFLASFTNGCP